MIRVQAEDFDLGEEYARFIAGQTSMGAVVTFTGLVRDFQKEGQADRVEAITLEHYAGMTEKELTRIRDGAHRRWNLSDSLIIHRYGRLNPGDQIVLVITGSSHREEAFQAAEFLMDYLKTRAPFWKKEETASGTSWVDAKTSDDDAADRWKD